MFPIDTNQPLSMTAKIYPDIMIKLRLMLYCTHRFIILLIIICVLGKISQIIFN